MSEKRNVRANQTRNSVRDEEARPMTAWKPPSLLDAPEARPGYVQRWVATSIQGKESPDNVYKRMREGWEPVKHSEHPEVNLPKNPNSQYGDSIEVGGLLLCKMPQEMVDQRNEYYKEKAEAQENAVDNNLMRQNDPRMPLFSDKKSTTTFGKK